jgi:hypothetical protein
VLRVDRASARDAQFVIEGLIPAAAARLRWLHLLGSAMHAADRVHRGSWAVTLFDDGLRLNVGTIETVVFRQYGAMLVLDSGHFSEEELHEIRMKRSLGSVDNYSSVRGTVNVTVKYGLDGEPFREARDALLSLVDRVASRVRTRTTYARTHSSGVVEYVRRATSQPLTQPDYDWGRPRTTR